jgi:5-methylthioadenosine/S-adenosylhomocysteine deaminase
MRTTLIEHATVVTVDSARRIIVDGSVQVDDDRITWVGRADEWVPCAVDDRLDATGSIVLPGLINAHTHTAYYIMRGRGMDRILLDWLQELVWPWLMAMDAEDVYAASLLGYLECVKSGTTCLIDNQNYPVYNKGNYDAAARAAELSGLRVSFACGFADIRFVSPPDFVDTPEEIEMECRRMIETWHGKGRLKVTVSPINLLYCSEESICRGVAVAGEAGVHFHTHVAESRKEHEALIERLGKGYLEAFADMHALGPRFQSVHSVWISDREIDLLAENGSSVVYNPTANMLLASGIAPIGKLQTAGVNIALGTDNPNNSNDMLEAMKFASLLQKVATLEPLAAPAAEVLEMATINGARALGMQDEIGSLEAGKKADLILVDALRPHNAPMHDPVATLVYSAQGSDVTDVMIDGEWIVRHSVARFVDDHLLVTEVQERAQRLAETIATGARLV